MLERKIKCDKCQKQFIQKWVVPQRDWSNINKVSYWTGGRNWNGYKLVCRLCLKDWYENNYKEFSNLIDPAKQKIFGSYRGCGMFDKQDRIN